MKTFKDTHGKEWSIVIDIAQIKAVRDLAKVDLYAIFGDEAKRLFSDPILLVDTLYVICKPQCNDRKMSDVDFGNSFSGDVLEAAADALLEEVVSFFPQSRRKILRATIDKAKQMADPVQEKILEKIAALSVTDLLKPIASPAS